MYGALSHKAGITVAICYLYQPSSLAMVKIHDRVSDELPDIGQDTRLG